MLHNLTYCKGEGCPIRGSCTRYAPDETDALNLYTPAMYEHGYCPMYYERRKVNCKTNYENENDKKNREELLL